VEPRFVHFDQVPPLDLGPGFTARPLFGEHVMVNLVELAPNAVVPLHSHPHEQLGIVLRGLQVLVLDGEEHHLGPLDGYAIPGGVEHSAWFGPEGATVLDVFQPVREDYLERWTGTR
jgi:quercetin dioxygenase-like cupin family protein